MIRLRFDGKGKEYALNAGDRYQHYSARGLAIQLGPYVFHAFIGKEKP